ncbi:oocyte-secreted protein 1 [Cervus elaphus]|uniref:oocyte-secreted protein 1 n=1 Tax=Cervus elaphus TaxID=9860 RepID=UPI001CC281C5|nr:oocyte-secreted protein 1 [Cervus elaphus]
MKTSLGLRGLFVLFSLTWTCAGDWSAVKVRCSYFWFYAKIKPTLFQNLYMNPDEAFLGDDCPVTYISPDGHYEFFYYSNKCGIITKTFQESLLLQTKVKYISSNSRDAAEMPLSCVFTKQASMYRLSNETESGDGETSSADMEVAYIMQSQNDLNTIFSPCAK